MLNKKINKFANEDVQSSSSANQSKPQKEKPSTYDVDDRKGKARTVGKWIIALIFIGLLVFLFWYACAPKSQKVSVKDYTVSDNKVNLITPSGTEVVFDLDSEGWSEYYLNTGNSVVFTMYAKSENYGTINFRVEEMKIPSGSSVVEKFWIGAAELKDSDVAFKTWLINATTNKATIPNNQTSWSYILINLLPTLILVGLMIWMYNRMAKLQGGAMGGEDSIFGMGKSQAKIAQSNVKFSDVAGIEEEKEELIEIVDYLKNPDKYAAMGARTPRGVILYGPPGTGKTLMAKAVAGEASVPFFSISGSDCVEMFVGLGASRVRDMFKQAKQTAPCLILSSFKIGFLSPSPSIVLVPKTSQLLIIISLDDCNFDSSLVGWKLLIVISSSALRVISPPPWISRFWNSLSFKFTPSSNWIFKLEPPAEIGTSFSLSIMSDVKGKYTVFSELPPLITNSVIFSSNKNKRIRLFFLKILNVSEFEKKFLMSSEKIFRIFSILFKKDILDAKNIIVVPCLCHRVHNSYKRVAISNEELKKLVGILHLISKTRWKWN